MTNRCQISWKPKRPGTGLGFSIAKTTAPAGWSKVCPYAPLNEIEFDMIGFGCGSCVYTIEKLGRKIAGVVDIHASLADKRVRVQYDGDRDTIVRQLTDIVSRIGHEIRERPA